LGDLVIWLDVLHFTQQVTKLDCFKPRHGLNWIANISFESAWIESRDFLEFGLGDRVDTDMERGCDLDVMMGPFITASHLVQTLRPHRKLACWHQLRLDASGTYDFSGQGAGDTRIEVSDVYIRNIDNELLFDPDLVQVATDIVTGGNLTHA
jgi:hypothetical protein